jgi:hypothetical protein
MTWPTFLVVLLLLVAVSGAAWFVGWSLAGAALWILGRG